MSFHMSRAMQAEKVKVKDFKKTLKQLFQYMAPFKFRLFFVFLFALGSTLFNVVGPFILAQATNTLYDGWLLRQSNPLMVIDLTLVYQVLIIAALIYTFSSVMGYLEAYMMIDITQSITFTLRKQISDKFNQLPLRIVDGQPIGDILSRITNDVDTINNSLQQAFTATVVAVVSIIGILVMMIVISIPMTLIALISLPISLFSVTKIVKFGQKYFSQRAKTLGQLNGHVEEMISNHSIISAFNGQDYAKETFNGFNDQLQNYSQKAEFFSSTMMPIVNFIGNLGYIAVVLVGALLMVNGQLALGSIQAFIMYIRNFNQPINQAANIATILQSTVAAAERIFEFLALEQETEQVEKGLNKACVGDVSFEHVDFGYSDDNIFIKDLSFAVKAGQKVAIVGPTGAGKTTLVNLLMRFYEVKSGVIKVDDQIIQEMDKASVRKLFGMVLQDTWLFNGTIEQNIKFGHLNATTEEMIEAAKAAKVDFFVNTLPLGYQTIINEEATNISAGQKQLITIARAFLANPPILILDEATSSVDTRTEILIQEAMKELMQNRTSFIIAHRLSTIINADYILVMNHGAIVESGNHESLMKQQGFYANLYNSQFETN